jgi:DNA-binding protein YbaB
MVQIRSLNELAEYAHQQVERVQRMQEEVTALSGSGESPRGWVRARTGPGGSVQELTIAPSALRLTAEEVAAEVIAAISAAQRDFSARADEIMAPVLGFHPGAQAVEELEAGMNRLDALADDLERMARRRGLDDRP